MQQMSRALSRGLGEGGMNMRTDTIIKMSISRLQCTVCGAEANASCNCAYLEDDEEMGRFLEPRFLKT
jgi:hypothetical protein